MNSLISSPLLPGAHLRVDGVSLAFADRRVLTDVSFVVSADERVGIIGENGSGKSTFTNMLTGILPISSGTFTLQGENVAPKNQVDANQHGIAIVVQETGTLSGLTVAENMFLGDEDQFIS